MNYDEFLQARKKLVTFKKYTKPGKQRGGVSYIKREDLAKLFRIEPVALELTTVKWWFWDEFREVLQPHYTSASPNGDGGFVLLRGTSERIAQQRASDD